MKFKLATFIAKRLILFYEIFEMNLVHCYYKKLYALEYKNKVGIDQILNGA